MSKINATVVADSVNPQGDRLTSLLITFPRILLSEVNTHRMLSKNTSSSRAIPFNKMVEAIENNPFIPIAWQKEHTGMQGYEYIIDEELINQCRLNWLGAKDKAIQFAKDANYNLQVTKQLCNRLLEPFMWTTMLITGSKEGWDNFFELRCPSYLYDYEDKPIYFKSKKDWVNYYNESQGYKENNPDFTKVENLTNLEWLQFNKGQAEIHMMALAEAIYDAVNESTPKQLIAGEWHIPFEDKIDTIKIDLKHDDGGWDFQSAKVKISTAMAAHTSYTTVGNEPVKSYEKWIELHDKLIAYNPPHSSPMEHCAKAMSDEEYKQFWKSNGKVNYKDKQDLIRIEGGWCYNLKGFISYRYMIDNKINL